MRGLHCERHANAERGQRDHRRRAHPDEHHLPEDLGDIEKLSGERRYEDPVKKVEVELKVIFQNAGVPMLVNAQNDKVPEMTKAESLNSVTFSAHCRTRITVTRCVCVRSVALFPARALHRAPPSGPEKIHISMRRPFHFRESSPHPMQVTKFMMTK